LLLDVGEVSYFHFFSLHFFFFRRLKREKKLEKAIRFRRADIPHVRGPVATCEAAARHV
jgi:hypothetical protein